MMLRQPMNQTQMGPEMSVSVTMEVLGLARRTGDVPASAAYRRTQENKVPFLMYHELYMMQ